MGWQLVDDWDRQSARALCCSYRAVVGPGCGGDLGRLRLSLRPRRAVYAHPRSEDGRARTTVGECHRDFQPRHSFRWSFDGPIGRAQRDGIGRSRGKWPRLSRSIQHRDRTLVNDCACHPGKCRGAPPRIVQSAGMNRRFGWRPCFPKPLFWQGQFPSGCRCRPADRKYVRFWHLADIAADFEHVRFQGIKRALEFAVEGYLLIGCHCMRGRVMMAVALSTSSYPSSQSH